VSAFGYRCRPDLDRTHGNAAQQEDSNRRLGGRHANRAGERLFGEHCLAMATAAITAPMVPSVQAMMDEINCRKPTAG